MQISMNAIAIAKFMSGKKLLVVASIGGEGSSDAGGVDGDPPRTLGSGAQPRAIGVSAGGATLNFFHSHQLCASLIHEALMGKSLALHCTALSISSICLRFKYSLACSDNPFSVGIVMRLNVAWSCKVCLLEICGGHLLCCSCMCA